MSNILQDLHKAPLLRVCIPLITGILVARAVLLDVQTLWIVFAFLFISSFLVYAVLKNYRNRYLFPIIISCLFIVSGALLYELQRDNSLPPKLNQNGSYVGYISSLPQQKKNSVFVEFTISSSDSVALKKPIKTWIYFEKSIPDTLLFPGNWLFIKAQLKIPEKNPLPTEFDFYTYLVEQKVHYTSYVTVKNVCLLQGKPHSGFKTVGLNVKRRVLEIFISNNIMGEELALLSALTIGYKKLIPAEQREAYAASGAMHVLAVSGLHVGILFVLFSYLFGFLKQLPFGNLWFTLVVILLMLGFAFITGFSPSVTRATIMFSFIAVGKLIRKQQYIVNTIAASACVMLLYQPNMLFQIGFQLSYIAVIGIVLFYPIFIEKWRVSRRIYKWLVGLILVSIIAQIITAPMNAFYFHRFANYSVIANLVVIPLVTILLNLTVLLIILGFVGIQFPLLAWMVKAVAKTMNTCVYGISNIPGSTFESLYLSPTESLVLYTVLLSVLVFFYYKSKWSIWFVLSALLVFTTQKTVVKYMNQQNKQVLVYENFGVPRLLIKGKNEGLVVYADSPKSLLFCPVWFFKNGISEEKVYAVNYNENVELNDFILYRNFIGFNKDVFKVVDNSKGEFMVDSTQLITTINLNKKSKWHIRLVNEVDRKQSNLNLDKEGFAYLNLNKIGFFNILVE